MFYEHLDLGIMSSDSSCSFCASRATVLLILLFSVINCIFGVLITTSEMRIPLY